MCDTTLVGYGAYQVVSHVRGQFDMTLKVRGTSTLCVVE